MHIPDHIFNTPEWRPMVEVGVSIGVGMENEKKKNT